MPNPRPAARVAESGYLQVSIVDPPGCLARFAAGARRVAVAVGWVAVGFLGGMVCRGGWWW